MQINVDKDLNIYDKKYFNYINNQGNVGVRALVGFYKGQIKLKYYNKDMYTLVSAIRVNVSKQPGMNYFYTPNYLRHWKRGTNEVIGLGSCWVDIDTEKVGISNERFEYFIQDITEQLSSKPKCIVHSGHGYYLFFPYKYEVIVHNRRSIISLWQLLEDTIVNDLNKILNDIFPYEQNACDKSATDPSRILRLQGSVNYKQGKAFNKCRTVWMNYDEIEYTFFNLCDNFLPPYDPNRVKYAKEYKKKHHINTQTTFSQMSLKVSRDYDFKKILQLRKNDLTNFRNNLIFLVACNASFYKNNQEVIEEIEWFNKQFTEPLPYREMKSFKYRIVYLDLGQRYAKIKNDKIIEYLGINEQEEAKLTTIISKKERYRRYNVKRNKKRQSNSKRRKTLRDNKIIRLHLDGMSNKAIATSLKISLSTVKRTINTVN